MSDCMQEVKILNAIPPGVKKDNAAFVANAIDTKDWERATFIFTLGDSDIAMAALKVQEADAIDDATTLTSGADVTGAIFGTSANTTGSTSSLPSATDDNKVYTVEMDLRGSRKRYLQLQATAGDGSTGTYGSAICILSRGKIISATVTDRGIAQTLRL